MSRRLSLANIRGPEIPTVDCESCIGKPLSQTWSTILAKMGLSPDSDSGTVEGALELIEHIAEKLEKMRRIQVEGIDTMNADLKAFSIEANRLTQMIAPVFNGQSAEQIAQTSAHRLDRESFCGKQSA